VLAQTSSEFRGGDKAQNGGAVDLTIDSICALALGSTVILSVSLGVAKGIIPRGLAAFLRADVISDTGTGRSAKLAK
jgi:hypothetical protein